MMWSRTAARQRRREKGQRSGGKRQADTLRHRPKLNCSLLLACLHVCHRATEEEKEGWWCGWERRGERQCTGRCA